MSSSPLIGPTDADVMLMRLDDRLRVMEQTSIVPAGLITFCPGVVPNGWLYCDGSTISAVRYGQLVAYLGGTTLPDLRGRVPVGKAAAGTFLTMLATGGEETHLLAGTESGIAAHTHGFQGWQTFVGPGGHATAQLSGNAADWGGIAGPVEAQVNTNAAAAHNNLQPFIVLLPIIKF